MKRTDYYLKSVILALFICACIGSTVITDAAMSYCYITEVKYEAVSNAVQIEVKADGILKWEWDFDESEADNARQLISVRFPNARLKLPDHFIDVDKSPVSSVMLYTPQDASDGTGLVMEVSLSSRSKFKGVGSTDERSFVLTVDAPQRADGETGDKPKTESTGTEQFLSVDVDEGKVSIRALRADIHRVLAEVARQTGLNVSVDDAVTHKVNINLRDLEPLEVIKAIATGYGLALSNNKDVYMLSEGVPKDLTTYNRSGTASFPMHYLRAEDAKELLPSFLTKYVHFNAEQNTVVATAPRQMLDKIQRDLETVDVPPPLIMIEVMAMELTNTTGNERDFSWLYESDDTTFGANSLNGQLHFRGTDTGGLTGGVIENTSRLTTFIKALESEGKAKIRSNPRIAAVNGKEASIFIGQDRFIIVEYNSGGTTQERIEGVPVGVKLEVQPWTGGNGEVTTTLDVEVSNISEIDPETGLPLLSSRKVSSTVRTRDGETIVIGGLRQKQTELVRRKVPILGDIPLIGQLFRSKSQTSIDSELVIFITPRILSNDAASVDPEQIEMRQRLLEPGDCGFNAEATVCPVIPGTQTPAE